MNKNELVRFTANVDGNGFSALPGLGEGYGDGRACGSNSVGMGEGVQWRSSQPSSFHGSGAALGRGFDDCVGGNRYTEWLRRHRTKND